MKLTEPNYLNLIDVYQYTTYLGFVKVQV